MPAIFCPRIRAVCPGQKVDATRLDSEIFESDYFFIEKADGTCYNLYRRAGEVLMDVDGIRKPVRRFHPGDTVYIIESNRRIREAAVVRSGGDFFTIRFKDSDGGIKVRGQPASFCLRMKQRRHY